MATPALQRRPRCVCFPPVIFAAAFTLICLVLSVWVLADLSIKTTQIQTLNEETIKLLARVNTLESRLPATQPHRP